MSDSAPHTPSGVGYESLSIEPRESIEAPLVAFGSAPAPG
jgi:hypothetical protein